MTIIYFIIVLSVTIFVHELGHFLFAKKAGIYVYEFCIGMGPRIFKFKRKNDETEYGIRLFPIGGFCSMAGESVEIDAQVEESKRLQSKTWLQRFLTISGGVMFNFIFAFIILFVVGLFAGYQNTKPVVSDVLLDGASYDKLYVGDVIKSVNGVKINSIDRFMIEYQIVYGSSIELEVERDGSLEKVKITPTSESDNIYQYGFSFDKTVNKGFLEAIKYSFTKFISLIEQMVVIIFYLFSGKLSLSSLSGPIGIYNIVGESAKAGFINLIYLIGYLSINVGFINLLPIPAFDGGRILFLLIEKIRRKPVTAKVENMIHSIGFILLMILMVLITYNDIIKFIIK